MARVRNASAWVRQSAGTLPGMVDTERTEEAVILRLAQNIGERRRALGLTQAQLAERLGVDTETLSRFERGKHAPTLKNLIRLAGLLQTTVADLLAEDGQRPSEDATIVTAWLDALSPADKVFAKAMLKQCCDYLSHRHFDADALGQIPTPFTVETVKRALVCPVEELERYIDAVLVLLASGLEVLVTGKEKQRVRVSSDNAHFLYRLRPVVREKVVRQFPERVEAWELQPPLKSYWIDSQASGLALLDQPKPTGKKAKAELVKKIRVRMASAGSQVKAAVLEKDTEEHPPSNVDSEQE